MKLYMVYKSGRFCSNSDDSADWSEVLMAQSHSANVRFYTSLEDAMAAYSAISIPPAYNAGSGDWLFYGKTLEEVHIDNDLYPGGGTDFYFWQQSDPIRLIAMQLSSKEINRS